MLKEAMLRKYEIPRLLLRHSLVMHFLKYQMSLSMEQLWKTSFFLLTMTVEKRNVCRDLGNDVGKCAGDWTF